jgi:hypothetical protein
LLVQALYHVLQLLRKLLHMSLSLVGFLLPLLHLHLVLLLSLLLLPQLLCCCF